MTAKPSILVASLAIILCQSACATRTSYQRPQVSLPATYPQALPEASPSAVEGQWWRRFGDAQLDALVDEVAARNTDLAQAAIAVRRSRLEAGLSVINPSVSANVSGSTTKALAGDGLETNGYGGNLTVGYEVDLFQRLAATRDAAAFEAQATEEDYAAARIALFATTATLYYQLGFVNERIDLAEESLAYARKTLELVEVQRRAGAVSSLEVIQAQQSLHSQQTMLEDLVRERVGVRNGIDLLLDGKPWQGQEPRRTPDHPAPTVAAGVPAELLGRRPDLRAAELRLRRQLSQADATRAGFYPRLSLTGQLGTSSKALSDLVKNPLGTLAADLALPFLQVDAMRLQTASARLSYESAVVGFRQTLYQALADVDNALADRRQYGVQSRLSAQALSEARRIEALTEIRYRAGSTTLKIWLDAQETRRQAEAAYAQTVLNARLSQITLYKALGGDA
jgi:NodT family efflux transporter outer membrane factor (OMF) lipoprotein